jgi:hypothetical protein
MAQKLTILTLSEFLKLRGKQKKPVIVHFDGKQWANLTRGLKPTSKQPPRSNNLTFILTTLPGLDGGLVEIRCPVGGPITGAEGELRCGKKPDVDFPDPDDPDDRHLEFCAKVLRKDGSVSCSGLCGNTRQRCRLRAHTVPSGVPGLDLVVTSCRCASS